MNWIKYNSYISVEPDYGLIKRNSYITKNGKIRKEKIIDGYLSDKGYLKFGLQTDNGYKLVSFHNIIWSCVNGKIPNGYEIHHVNHNKLDNRIGNLCLVSHEEHNKIHAKDGGIANYNKYGNTLTKELRKKAYDKTSVSIIQLDKDDNIIEEFSSIHNAANKLNLCVQNIHKVCKGERKTCGGFKFKYK